MRTRPRVLDPRFFPLWVVLLALPASWPLLRSGFFVSDDGLFHVYRIAALADAWRQGVLYPRLFPDFGFGYGQAVLNYYAPLTYIPGAVLALLGIAPATAAKLTIVVGIFLAAVAAYGYVNYLWGPRAGLLAAVAYTYFPYHLADVYVRGAIPEQFAFIFPPLILWAYTAAWRLPDVSHAPLPNYQKHTSPVNPWLWGSIAWAGLVYTHNLTALMFAPIFVLYLGCLEHQRVTTRARSHFGQHFMALAGSLCLAVALSAPLWLPFIVESRAVGLGWDASAGYAEHLAPLRLAIQFAPFYHYRAIAGGESDHPISWLTVALFFAALALCAWRLARRHEPRDWSVIAFAFVTTLASAVMTTRPSLPVWRVLQPGIENLQYPWRFLAITAIGVALLAGSLAELLTRPKPSAHMPDVEKDPASPLSAEPRRWEKGGLGLWLLTGLASLLFIAVAAPLLPWQPLAVPAADTASPERMWREDAEHGQVGATWTGEFLPTTVQEQRWALGRPACRCRRRTGAPAASAVEFGGNGLSDD